MWNTHRIRSYRNQIMTTGRPCMMYRIPQSYGTRDYGEVANYDDIAACVDEVHHKRNIPCESVVYELCILNINEHKLPIPTDPNDMYDLYSFLRTVIRNAL